MKEEKTSLTGSARENACVVMVCADGEADQINRQLAQADCEYVVTYRRLEDLLLNAPTKKVALVILAKKESPAVTRQTLRWLKHRWPDCPVAVLGDSGSDVFELAARRGGALYLTRPVPQEHWTEMVWNILGRLGKAERASPAEEGSARKRPTIQS